MKTGLAAWGLAWPNPDLHRNPAFASPAGTRKSVLMPVDMRDITLLKGPWLHHFALTRDYVDSLENEAFLEAFHKAYAPSRVPEPRPKVSWGGWVGPKHNWGKHDGEFQGHYLSACARIVALGRDDDIRRKSCRLVEALARYQHSDGFIYVGVVTRRELDALFRGSPSNIPLYVIHKLLMGLIELYLYAGDEQALAIAVRYGEAVATRLGRLSDDNIATMLLKEHGGIAEVMLDLASITKSDRLFTAGLRLLQDAIVAPLAHNEDILAGKHANTTIPILQGAARAFELTGEDRYRAAVENFWRIVFSTRSYATGGSSYKEFWQEPNALKATLSASTQETCTSYNWLRLTDYLIRWSGAASYGDAFERCQINGVLPAQHPVTGQFIYYLPLRPGPREPNPDSFDPDPPEGGCKHWGRPLRCFWCCYGTGVQAFSYPVAGAYYKNEETLWVNRFIASRVSTYISGRLLTLEQHTDFPFDDHVKLAIGNDVHDPLTVAVRIPWWTDERAAVMVNGTRWQLPDGRNAPEPSSWLAIRRTWRQGDTVEIRAPMHLYIQAINDDPNCVALLYGPHVLAGCRRAALPVPTRHPADWLHRIDSQGLAFLFRNSRIEFVPLSQVIDEEYDVYFDLIEQC